LCLNISLCQHTSRVPQPSSLQAFKPSRVLPQSKSASISLSKALFQAHSPRLAKMSASRVLFVPRAVLLKTPSLRGCRGIVEVAVDAIKPLPVQPPKSNFWAGIRAEAEKLGHICEDYEMDSDGDSPLEWCPACKHVETWRSRDAWGKALLAGVNLNPLERSAPQSGGCDFKQREEARFQRWASTLKPLDLFTLRAGGIGAKLLVKEGFYGVQMSWCDKMIAQDPDFLTRRMPEVVRPVFVAPLPRREEPVRIALPRTAPAVAIREFVSRDARPAAEKEAEYADWIANSKRPLWTNQGPQPYRAISESNRSSLLVTGFGPEVSLAEIREIAAGFAPVRDVFRPARAQHMVFVGYVGASAASDAKSFFRANPISLGGRPLVFDVSVKK
jgi:hypothetical protein